MKKPVIIIMCLWAAIVLEFTSVQEYALHTGQEVLLKTIPVDPRDLIRGDYVILNYEIAQLKRDSGFKWNDTVYVSLNVDENNIATVSEISKTKPSKPLFMKGTVKYSWRQGIEFGIESYFVKEGTGRELENQLRDGALVKVAITKNGFAKVKGFVK